MNEGSRIRESLPYQHRVFSYIDRGYYAEQILRLKNFFNDDQLLFLKYEIFKQHPDQTLNKIFKFLDANENIDIVKTNVHRGNYNYKMSAKIKDHLLDIYSNEISAVEKLLGWDCSDWKS